MKHTIILAALLAAGSCSGEPVDRLLDAIRFVESSSRPPHLVPDGDGGASIGPFQIGRLYWMDSGVDGEWEDCRDLEYSRRVVLAYFRRYGKEALRVGDWERLARMHNGGPRGHLKQATRTYWFKVERRMQRAGEVN
jgi:hypothetical protein